MNHEMYRDRTAEEGIQAAERDRQRARQARMEKMRRASMVYVIIPGLEGVREEEARRKRLPAIDYVLRKGSIPCLNECDGLEDPEMDEALCRVRASRLIDLCSEVWVFGSLQGRYTRRAAQAIREAREKRKTVRSIYLAPAEPAGREK